MANSLAHRQLPRNRRLALGVLPLWLLVTLLAACTGGRQQEKPEGLRLMEVQGCIACHSLDGSKRIGPHLNGVFGSTVVVTSNGKTRTIIADRAYLKRSILDPRADVVAGFESTMPTNFKNQLGEKNLNTILDYLESIGHQ